MADFLPVNKKEMLARGWNEVDFVLVSGDAYVDHPSFGAAILSRVLENAGFRVGMLAQPDVKDAESFKTFGAPRYGFFISGGVVDSMVAHYTVAKRRRARDEYSPGGVAGKRPDRVVEVYTQLAKAAYPGKPVVAGGVEASLRRFAHYDYWTDEVRSSILETSGADMVSFGMGEASVLAVAQRLAVGEAIGQIRDVPGTAVLADFAQLPKKYAECASFAKVKADKAAYAKACRLQMDNQDPATALPVVQKQSERYLVQNLPALPLSREALDAVYALPYMRRWHPMYDTAGGVPALEEVEFSLTQSRGCFGGCNFCAITLHQGRRVASRSADSLVAEAKLLTGLPGFKGYIHDVGGPTANFRAPSCEKQQKDGVCGGGKHCLAPSPCGRLQVDHSEYLAILQRLRALPGVKKVFIRSGIRFDYLVYDKDESFFKELVAHHVSGQLKVAPEHCSAPVLAAMGKPAIEVYDRFAKRFTALSKQAGKEQYLVPYLLSSHPGSTLKDAVKLAEYLYEHNLRPEQVQDFYPTPGTISTCMYHTGLDPFTMKPVYVAKDGEEKAMQRALLQYALPKNAARVRKALELCGRQDLIPKLLAGGRKMTGQAAGAPEAARRSGQGNTARKDMGRQSAEKQGAGKPRNAGRKGAGARNQSPRAAARKNASRRKPGPKGRGRG